jgi:hypothetical protein
LNLRRVRQIAEPAVNCAINSYGQVRDFSIVVDVAAELRG